MDEMQAMRDLLTIQSKKIESLEIKIAIVSEFLARALEAIAKVEETK